MSRTPTKVRARREKISDYFNSIHEPPERDTQCQVLSYTPSGQNVHIPTKNLIYENTNVAIFDKNSRFGPNSNVQSSEEASEEEQERCHHFDETYNSSQRRQQSKDLSNFLYNLWQDRRMCDIILKANGREFPAHKIALAAHSEKFTTRYCEHEPRALSEIILPNTSAESAEDILKYIYTSEIDLSPQNVEPILICARQLGVTSAEYICLSYISNFNEDNVFLLLPIAERQGLVDISSRMNTFVGDHFAELSKCRGFLHCYVEHVKWFLSSDAIVVPSELDIFYAAMSWIEYNRQERLKFAADLMGCVRFHYILPESLVNYVEPVQYIFDIPECKEMLYAAFRYHSLQLSGCSLVNLLPIPRPRRYSKVNSKSCDSISHNHVTSDSAKEVGEETAERCQTPGPEVTSQMTNNQNEAHSNSKKKRKPFAGSVAVYGTPQVSLKHPPPLPGPPKPRTFIAIGGVNPFNTETDLSCRLVEEFNVRSNSWNLLTSLPVARHHLGATFLDGYLYVVGGSIITKKDPTNLANPTDVCFRYDMKGNYWSRIASLKIPRMYHCASVLEGVLYAAGGQDQNGRQLDSVEYYNPDNDSWGFASPMAEAKIGAASIGYKGLLFLIGGFVEHDNVKYVLDTVDCYDPRTNSWTQRNPLPTPCCHCNLVEAKESLFLIGGSTSDSTGSSVISLPSVYCYDFEEDTWEIFSNLATPRHDAGATVIGTKIFVVGGVSSLEGGILSDIECLDVETRTFKKGLYPLSHPAMGVTCCTVPIQND